MQGIDVSAYQGMPDWGRVRESGVKYAILRVSTRNGVVDSSFLHNYQQCIANGIAVGVYKFSYALNAEQAADEARNVLSIISGRQLTMAVPVWLDLEWSQQRALGRTAISKIALAFIGIIQEAGYKCGIYCNKDWYQNVLDTAVLDYPYWIARYPAADNGTLKDSLRPCLGEDIWQYSSKGAILGISGYVDMNIAYTDAVISPQQPQGGAPDVSEGNGIGKLEDGIIAYSRSRDGNRALTVNFKVKEFACDGADEIMIDGTVVKWLQAARNKFGAPLYITSGYRTCAHNQAVGGAKNSYHMSGMAVDHNARNKVSVMRLARFYERLGVPGIIVYPTFVHIDSRTKKYYSSDSGKSACTTFHPTLRMGSKGEVVEDLQELLLRAGYSLGDCGADAIYGAATEAAVKSYQVGRLLTADGIVGPKTWAALFKG